MTQRSRRNHIGTQSLRGLLKRVSVEHHGIEPAKFNDETIWYPIYKFPYLDKVRTAIRVKVYVTIVSLGACTTRSIQYLFDSSLPLTYMMPVSFLALTGMYMAGNFARKFVCQAYTTEDNEYVRLTRFTSFGRRRDMVLPTAGLKPLTDTNKSHRAVFLKLETERPEKVNLEYDNYEFYDEKFNIVLLFGGISDEDRFDYIFGKLLRKKP